MVSSNILPDVTGRDLGAADKQWDAFIRNLVVSGSVSGQGLDIGNIQNLVADHDSLAISSDQTNSGNPASLINRVRVNNPSSGPVVTTFKNSQVYLGGIVSADSPSVPMYFFCNAAEPTGNGLFQIFQRGSNTNASLIIDMMGRINSYAAGYTSYAFQVVHFGDSNAMYAIGVDGSQSWGAGGVNVPDLRMWRSGISALTLDNYVGTARASLLARQFIADAPVGTPPLVVTSTTLVTNLNADKLDGSDWSAPPTIGSVTPGASLFTTVAASGQISANLNDGSTPPLVVPSQVPVPNLTVQRLDSPIVNGVVNLDGSGMKHNRVTIPSIAAGAFLSVTVTWTTAFSSASYTTVATVFDPTTPGGNGIRLLRKTGQSATSSTFLFINDDTIAHAAGVLHVIAFRG